MFGYFNKIIFRLICTNFDVIPCHECDSTSHLNLKFDILSCMFLICFLMDNFVLFRKVWRSVALTSPKEGKSDTNRAENVKINCLARKLLLLILTRMVLPFC